MIICKWSADATKGMKVSSRTMKKIIGAHTTTRSHVDNDDSCTRNYILIAQADGFPKMHSRSLYLDRVSDVSIDHDLTKNC